MENVCFSGCCYSPQLVHLQHYAELQNHCLPTHSFNSFYNNIPITLTEKKSAQSLLRFSNSSHFLYIYQILSTCTCALLSQDHYPAYSRRCFSKTDDIRTQPPRSLNPLRSLHTIPTSRRHVPFLRIHFLRSQVPCPFAEACHDRWNRFDGRR